MYRGVEENLHLFLTYAQDWREWPALATVALLLGKEPAFMLAGAVPLYQGSQSIIILVEIKSNFSTPHATSTRMYFQKYTTLSGRL
jgi:hypothetical protein